MFVLDPTHHRNGYGAEVVRGLLTGIRSAGPYRAVCLRVYRKNRAALRFWARAGFTEVVRFDAAGVPEREMVPSLVLRESEAAPAAPGS